MSNYADKLRKERRQELALRALPEESFNEYGEVCFASKTEAGASFPSSAYAYVPDANMPSTWKLRLWASPTGGPDSHIVGAAIAALGAGFRGNKVQIPADELPSVKAKVKAAWIKANPDKKPSEMPSFSSFDSEDLETFDTEDSSLVACGDHGGPDVEFHIEVDDITVTPSVSLLAAFKKLVEAAQFTFNGSNVSVDVDIDVDTKSDPQDDYDVSLEVDEDGLSQTPSDIILNAFTVLQDAVKAEYKFFEIDVDIDVESNENMAESNDIAPAPSYGYSIETEEFGTLPPFLAAGLIKKLKADLVKETDPTKKAAIQAKIDKFTVKK